MRYLRMNQKPLCTWSTGVCPWLSCPALSKNISEGWSDFQYQKTLSNQVCRHSWSSCLPSLHFSPAYPTLNIPWEEWEENLVDVSLSDPGNTAKTWLLTFNGWDLPEGRKSQLKKTKWHTSHRFHGLQTWKGTSLKKPTNNKRTSFQVQSRWRLAKIKLSPDQGTGKNCEVVRAPCLPPLTYTLERMEREPGTREVLATHKIWFCMVMQTLKDLF